MRQRADLAHPGACRPRQSRGIRWPCAPQATGTLTPVSRPAPTAWTVRDGHGYIDDLELIAGGGPNDDAAGLCASWSDPEQVRHPTALDNAPTRDTAGEAVLVRARGTVDGGQSWCGAGLRAGWRGRTRRVAVGPGLRLGRGRLHGHRVVCAPGGHDPGRLRLRAGLALWAGNPGADRHHVLVNG